MVFYETTLEPGQTKSDFDKHPVLERMEIQLLKSGVETEFTKNIDLSAGRLKIFHIWSRLLYK